MAKSIIKTRAQKRDDEPLEFEVSAFDDLRSGCYDLIAKLSVKDKSKEQLGAIFGLMIFKTIAYTNENSIDTSDFLKLMIREDLPSGNGLTVGFLKELLYCLCPMHRNGKRITLKKASTVEAMVFFKECCNLLASRGIYVPEPDPEWKIKDKEK